MFQRTKLNRCLLTAFSGAAMLSSGLAFGQAQLERVEITGSSIKRSIASEGALPVTILKAEDLRQQGVTSVEGIVQLLTASQSSDTGANSIGSGTGGAAYANLRGLGISKTLVLLNGRRVAAFAFDGAGVDLNSIPFAVIDRVEVLRDGASAIYGTDAISGVINFITKKTFNGGTITLEAIKPVKSGGSENRGSVVLGFGDLEKEGVNFWLSFDKQNKDRLRALDRSFSASGVIPSKGVSGSSPTTFPGNFSQNEGLDKKAVSGNITAPACKPPLSIVSPSNPAACVFDFSATIDTIPDIQQETVAGRFSFKLGQNNVLSAEVMSTDNRNVARVAQDPVSNITIAPNSPYFPTGFPNVDPTKSVTAGWRMVPAGNRTNESLSNAQRIVLDLTGSVANTDYRLGYFYSVSSAQDGAIDGYVNAPFVRAQVAAGNLNPFADATPAQLAIIEQAKRKGTFVVAEGITQGIDLRVSRELFALGGGSAAMSAGVEFRKEFYKSDTDDAVVAAIPSAGRSPDHVTGSRDVKAVSAELLLPFTKMLEMQLAARYDQYSDAGSTFNPKIGLRFQPMKELVVRTSYNTGFRAPTLDELYSSQTVTFAGSNSNDPLLCPGGTANAAAGGVTPRDCAAQVQRQAGGNPTLAPEKSKTFSLGFAIEPIKNFTFSADYFKIQLKDQVGTVPVESIIADPVQYAAKYVRCKDLSVARQQGTPELQRCFAGNVNSNAIAYLITTNDNLGKVNTSGIDFAAGYSMAMGAGASLGLAWDATWVRSYLYQNTPTDVFKENVGKYSDGSPVFRWQHSFAATWTQANWSSRLAVRHKTGYYDMNLPSTVVGGPDFYQFVKPYTLVDLSFTAKPVKALSITAGLKNLFDTDPSFSNQSTRSQRGYDPRYTDPLGRTMFVRGTYTF
jgi:iron complex outermembrane recepter protein